MSVPLIDIIIPVYNNFDYTIRCFQSIKEHTDPEKYNLIVIDNGSEDNQEEFLEELESHPHFLIKNDTNRGFIKATNQGIGKSKSDYVVLLNNDTEVVNSWLEKLYEVFVQRPDAGLVGPATIHAESWQNVKHNRNWPISSLPYFRVNGMLAFFCVMISRKVINIVGLLDEQYGVGFGDDDAYCAAATQMGFKLYLRHDLIIPHYHRTTFKKYIPNWEQLQQKNIDLFKKNWGV